MAVPYSFATQTGSIPLSQLDSNFATAITLGNTAVVLGNTYSTIGNLTLSNVTISSGNVSINVSNVSTLNVVTLTVTGNETVGGNVTITGNVSVNVANVTTLNATSSTITGNETVGGNVTVTGNVGIGTSSPSAKLEIVGTTSAVVSKVTATTGAPYTVYGNSGSNFFVGKENSAGGSFGTTAYASLLYEGGAYPMVFFTNAAERMRIDSSGNVGIGTTSPASGNGGGLSLGTTASGKSLHLYPSTYGGSGLVDFYGTDGASKMQMGAASATASFVYSNVGSLLLGGNGSEAMRIDSSGNLLVGTTSTGPVNANAITIEPANSRIRVAHSSTANGVPYIQFDYNGTNIGSITQSTTTSVLYNTTSDQRLKENIADAPEFGGVIDSIQVRQYDWKSDGSHQRAGFVAQELVTVAPEAVHQPADAEEMMAVDYSKLVPMLVKEIQDLRKRLAALEAK